MKLRPRRAARYYYLKLLRMEGSVHSIARGVALGMFIGISPTMPLHTIAILIFAPLLRANLLATFLAATIVMNPFNFILIYYLCWLVGDWLLPCSVSWERIEALLAMFGEAGFKESLLAFVDLGEQALATLLLGGVVIATPLTVASYFLTVKILRAFRSKRRRMHILN